MICKLCLQEKKLLKQSHIIPNFLYKELLKEDGFFVKANLKDLTKKPLYTGIFDRYILCKECDNNTLSKLEDYACKVLYGVKKIKGVTLRNEVNQHGVEWTMVYGIDYRKFKLFLLSLLWRFSISSHEAYKYVNLGLHEEKIREMIFKNDPKDILDYPCSISSYRKHTDLSYKVISQPLKHHNENGGICYSIIINGFIYNFHVSKNLTPDYISEIIINKNNELKVIHMPKENAIKIIKKYTKLPK